MSEAGKPLDRCPSWPEQAGFMRAQCCITVLQPFMSDAEYLAVRGRIAAWDTATDPISERHQAAVRKRWEAGGVKPHQQRVADEKRDLDERIAKLDAFFQTETYAVLDGAEMTRLAWQASVMADYSQLLGERIAAFQTAQTCPHGRTFDIYCEDCGGYPGSINAGAGFSELPRGGA